MVSIQQQLATRTLAHYLQERIRKLGIHPDEFADKVLGGKRTVSSMMLKGEIKVPAHLVSVIAQVLKIDEIQFRKRWIDAYNLDVGISRSPATSVGSARPHQSEYSVKQLTRLPEALQYDVTDSGPVTFSESLILPALRIRELFRSFPQGFRTTEAARHLSLPAIDAQSTLAQLYSAGVVDRIAVREDPATEHWIVSDRGKSLASRSGPEMLTRVSAVEVLARFFAHVANVNASTLLAYRIESVGVIGEVLTDLSGGIPFVEVTVQIVPSQLDPVRQDEVEARLLAHLWGERLRNRPEDLVDDLTQLDLAIQTLNALEAPGLPIAMRFDIEWRND